MSLIGEKRKAYILNQLNAKGQVKTFELVQELGVSAETIRRYLEELESEQRLKRKYGGAIKLNLGAEEPSYLKREVLNAEEKRRIGQAAATLVEDNDIIFIDDGSTPLQMIEYLMDKGNLTVLTMSMPALHALVEYQNKGLFTGEIYFIGGKVNSKHARVTGSIAEKMVSLFHVDKAFISIDGMVLDSGITAFDAERGQLASKIMENANTSIVMADNSKIGQVRLYKMADWRSIDVVICDAGIPSGWQKTLEKNGVTWIEAS